MKITKTSTISVALLIPILTGIWWFDDKKADTKVVEKIETKVEEKAKEDQEFKLKNMEIETRQQMMIDYLGEQVKEMKRVE